MFAGIVTMSGAMLFAEQSPYNVLPDLTVVGKRPLKDIGIQKTTFDSLALKENAALSMADILAFNSSLYVKSYGRATLSTVSFRGTSPSHTQVTWNGMRINNPMMGMTDFSTIPSFFVDKAALLHGSSAINETGGALGGSVQLASVPENMDSTGLRLQYVQGIGSFRTFDEFLRGSWSNGHWNLSTRLALSSSPNDYKYTNHDKKENIYDEEHNIVGQYYPIERNRSGSYRDFHAMQQVYYTTGRGDRIGVDAWYINSNRELPMLTTDYGDERSFENRQREQTFRAVASWSRNREAWSLAANAGYAYIHTAYDYKREITEGNWGVMSQSRSRVNTVFARAEATWYVSKRWLFTGNLAFHQHFVLSKDKNVILTDGGTAKVGYDKSRSELSAAVSAKWQPVEPLGISLVMRQEVFGAKTATIPAFFIDGLLYKPVNLMVKASVSRNYKFPSLNDLYFMPGGNPDLRNEKGFTYDAGVSVQHSTTRPCTLVWGASVNWFDSYIDDWIIWLPTPKGFFSPRNVKSVHAYGIEAQANLNALLGKDWALGLNGTYSWTPSINRGNPLSAADQSVGKQLPYVPVHSASLTGRLTWKTWSLLYKWNYYSRRYTMSSNDISLSGQLPPYFMNNVVIQKDLYFKPIDLQLKLAVNNIFNEEYLSVLAHPMPGINFEFFVTLTPKF